LNELDDEDADDETAKDVEDENNEDEIDPSVAESDAAIVDAVAAEVEEQSDLPTLTRLDINLGKFAVTKVRVISIG
jgi:hypothetical protein